MAFAETALEWPRFCYGSTPSMFEDDCAGPAAKRARISPSAEAMATSKPWPRDEQRVPGNSVDDGDEFVFSRLMRSMAQKYNQQPAPTQPQQQPSECSVPFLPTLPNLSLWESNPWPFSLLLPQMLMMSRMQQQQQYATTATSPTSDYSQSLPSGSPVPSVGSDASDAASDVVVVDAPAPLDLSSASVALTPMSEWDVDRVAEFVASVDGCRDFAQAFRDHAIDGSTLVFLSESHLTGILGLKLGPAIRLIERIRARA